MRKGVKSSGQLTNGSLFALNVHECWQWEVSLEIVFLRKLLKSLKANGLSCQATGNGKVSMKEDEVVKTFRLKLSKRFGMAQHGHLLGLVIDQDYNTKLSFCTLLPASMSRDLFSGSLCLMRNGFF